MAALTREQIDTAAKALPKMSRVPVPELGGDVCFLALSAETADNWDISLQKGKGLDLENVVARFCAMVICDEAGNKMYTHEEAAFLGTLSSAPLRRIYRAAMKFNGLGADSVEEAEKNSETAPGSASPTASPAT